MEDLTLDDYFGPYTTHPDAKPGKWSVADLLLEKVNALLLEAEEDGVEIELNPNTGNHISGSGNGGFRPMDCKVGHPLSAHKSARAVDIYDPYERLDDWLTDETLVKYKLYRESPFETENWVHLQDTAPRSGKRTFMP